MNNNTQTNNDFTAGFLTKDKKGKLKKVNDNEVIDYKKTSKIIQDEDIAVLPISATPVQNKSEINLDNKKVDISIQESDNNKFDPVVKPIFVAEQDEEEEIRNHQKELDKILSETSENVAINKNDLSILINSVINKFKLNFEADVYKKRFIKISESRLKEIRSTIETQEVLHRVKKIGGLEFTEKVAKDIVKELNIILKNLSEKKEPSHKAVSKSTTILNEETKKQTMFSSAPPAFVPIPSVSLKTGSNSNHNKQEPIQNNFNKSEKVKKNPTEIKKVEIIEPVKESPTKYVEPQIKNNIKNDKEIEKEKKQLKLRKEEVNKLYVKTPSEAIAKIAKARQIEPGKTEVIDIRQPANIIGPVEEIGEIDKKEFRRMGNNPANSSEKVIEKIYLLEEDSWEERMRGLSSWQQSPIYKLYIKIGRASIKNGVSVEKIINRFESEGKENLHLEEFLAINSLNNQLTV